MTEYEEWQNTPGRFGIFVSKGDFKERRMETLGILHTGKAGKPRVKSIAAMWNFDGDCPHVMTEARIQKKGSHDMVTVSALWDTGASTCAISKELAHEIGLKPTGSTQCDVAGGGILAVETAQVLFALPDGTAAETEAAIIEMPERPYNFIVGMSIILQGDFIIHKTQDGFDFTFKIQKP